MADPLRVIIAEDNYLVREGTRRLLEDSGEVAVLAAVGNATELLDAVARLKPDAVITDIKMPPGHHMEGIEAAHQIRASHPEIGVVVLSQHSDDVYAYRLLRDGTAGLAYLLKERIGDLDSLVQALRAVSAGGSVIDPKVVEALVSRRVRETESPLGGLTARELVVLQEMAQGKSNQAIGQSLHISESAVEKQVTTIFSKLQLSEERQMHRRVSAVLTFLREARAEP
jgi:DNA-binding NarL/FixJ family response regulator